MKLAYALVALSMVAAGSASAQTKPNVCADSQAANAAVIAKAQAAGTPAQRFAIVKAAIDANPANAACLTDLALQMALASNIDPAAGPEEFGQAEFDDSAAPTENPNQLNQNSGSGNASSSAI